jgi:hypothetical protein
MKAPRGFAVTRSDHFGPLTWERQGKRVHYRITWERRAHGALNLPDTTGYRLYAKANGRWSPMSPIKDTPTAAWAARAHT